MRTYTKHAGRVALLTACGVVLIIAIDTVDRLLQVTWRVGRTSTDAGTARATRASYPYTAVFKEENHVLRDGSIRAGGRHTTATRSDGSRVLVFEKYNVRSAASMRTIQLASGETLTIDDVREILHRSSRDAPMMPDPEKQCVSLMIGNTLRVVGDEVINGYKTVKMRVADDFKAITLWRAPELGCVELKTQIEFLTAGFINVRSLVSINVGEPPNWLFEVPLRYRKVSLSQYRRGGSLTDFTEMSERSDQQ